MKNKIESLLEDIGRLLVEAAGSEPDGILLYSEGERAMFGAKIFQDVGGDVVYFFPGEELTKKLFDLWDFSAENEKWGAMIYTISEGKFDAIFEYPDEWDPAEYYSDRCMRLEAARYGNKRIVKRGE